METKTSGTVKNKEGKSALSDKKSFAGESDRKLKEMGERTAEAEAKEEVRAGGKSE